MHRIGTTAALAADIAVMWMVRLALMTLITIAGNYPS